MLKSLIFFIAVFSIAHVSGAQDGITTFILVRHAEKGDDGTKDPDLTPAGVNRANRLAEMLTKTSVQAIYSTSFKRTRHTVEPLAKAKGLEILTYDGLKAPEIEKMMERHAGGTVVISGHSNNIPWIANLLTGGDAIKDFADTDYENLLIVSVFTKGKVAKVTWLTY